ncbi:hypothetical protein SAY86_005445 [Trapa natans]|uniref:Uncharacterized protein n=1 Tax=Trapa natans TaxID=22666 RepID=A0AAN7L011_TRANT|nr:hypothetical protein SAY86_005445 [Trapa natans]
MEKVKFVFDQSYQRRAMMKFSSVAEARRLLRQEPRRPYLSLGDLHRFSSNRVWDSTVTHQRHSHQLRRQLQDSHCNHPRPSSILPRF